jgi:hypothetical protein
MNNFYWNGAIYRILAFIKRWTTDFDGDDIFYNSHITFGDSKDCWGSYNMSERRDYTPLGQWFEDKPLIFSIVKIPYYIVTFFWELIGAIIWGIIYFFIPRHWGLD